MKSPKTKQKTDNDGNSEFTRNKLEEEYNPKCRFFKNQLMSFTEIPERNRHDFMAKEENDICERAVQQLKRGSNLVIDWNTRTNFRVTRSILPRLKTQPTDNTPKSFNSRNESSMTLIQSKRIQLARLLHIRHKKKYLQSKKEQLEEKRLFGYQVQKQTSRFSLESKRNHLQHSRESSKQSMDEVQKEILHKSKLRILKGELQAKFQEIRQIFHQDQRKVKPRASKFFSK